jgi:hypothetical protein
VYQIAITAIFLLSGSISGGLILIFVLGVINFKHIKKKTIYIIPFSIVLILFIIIVIKDRTYGTYDITTNTRYEFLLLFINETKNWSIFDLLIGAPRITSLSDYACYSQYRWTAGLFSYEDNGECYSVIFHSYILRVIHDHGILGLLFIVCFIFKIIISAGYKHKTALVIIAIALINGLSVSAFNSIYFVTGLFFFLILNKKYSFARN